MSRTSFHNSTSYRINRQVRVISMFQEGCVVRYVSKIWDAICNRPRSNLPFCSYGCIHAHYFVMPCPLCNHIFKADLFFINTWCFKQHTTSRAKQRISVAHYSLYTVLILFINIVIPLFGIITKIPKYHIWCL